MCPFQRWRKGGTESLQDILKVNAKALLRDLRFCGCWTNGEEKEYALKCWGNIWRRVSTKVSHCSRRAVSARACLLCKSVLAGGHF